MVRAHDGDAAGDGGILLLPGWLRRDLVLLTAAKFALLGILYLLFFSPAHRPAIDVPAHIAGMPSQR